MAKTMALHRPLLETAQIFTPLAVDLSLKKEIKQPKRENKNP